MPNHRYMSFRPNRFPVFVLIASGLMGCGAGTSVSQPPTGATRNLQPNYVAALQSTRYWNKSQLSVRVGTTGRNISGPLQSAIGTWAPTTNGHVQLTTTTASTADITITLVAPGTLAGNAVGITQVRFQLSNQQIVSATIQVDSSLNDTTLAQVLAHELGHALGIDGHSPTQTDLMYFQSHLPLVVTTQDSNTLLTIYTSHGRAIPAVTAATETETETVCAFPRP